MFPPGLAKLATNPLETGSLIEAKTMGIVLDAFLIARIAGVVGATMRSTFRWTSSAANSVVRSCLPSDISIFNDNVLALYVAEITEPVTKRVDAGLVSASGGP